MGTFKSATLNNISVSDKFSNSIYYGVYTPSENTDGRVNVFDDKFEALKLAKKSKKSRFKAFRFYHEAVEFSLNGSECPNNNASLDIHPIDKKNAETVQTFGEKASPFKGPKPQDLVEFRKTIEVGNVKAVQETIWQNPRYLVSSGDTPSILQEGSRYNALHVAAKVKNAEITEIILDTISNPEFVKLLYGDDNQENAEERCRMLLDLYLNTPNKGLNETPLHFASKYGAADVVEILVSYPQCNKHKKNKYHKTAIEMICERFDGNGAESRVLQKKIEVLLEDNYYVPVLRTEDNSLPPIVGEPFSPTNLPVLNKDPLSPRLEIHAYAGPMDKKGAQHFRKAWKTPPRSLNFFSPNDKKQSDELTNLSSLRFKDPQKGLEIIGKKLANKFDVQWKEYWPFLSSFVDITSDEGLAQLETYLSNRYGDLNESISNSPVHLERTDIISPITNLCAAFSACRLNDSVQSTGLLNEKSDFDALMCVEKACQVFANRISNSILYVLCNNNDTVFKVLENEIKQLELLVNSYMDDNRFSDINFQKIHFRLGVLIGQRLYNNIREEDEAHFLCEKIENILDVITKSVDCFSSDDEGLNLKDTLEQKKPTMYRKQLICLVHVILNILSQNFGTSKVLQENHVKESWDDAVACPCVYHVRKSKKTGISRSSISKNGKVTHSLKMESFSKKLCFDENIDCSNKVAPDVYDHNDINLSLNVLNQFENDSEDDEIFYTPPSSPSFLSDNVDSDSDDEFNETELAFEEVFLEGEYPTKTDAAVYNSLRSSAYTLDKEKHPNIYRWHHNISLYSEIERHSWPSPNSRKSKEFAKCSPNIRSPLHISSPLPKTSTPSKSWLRITGANSPRAVFKSFNNHF